MPLIQLKNISKKFGRHLVLDNVNFDVDYKDVFGVIGISGSGKTTILNIMIGFLRASSGQVTYQGRPISKEKSEIERTFGFATQGGSFYGKLSTKENLVYFGKLYGLGKGEIEERAKELLNLVELQYAQDTLANELSTGMQRRLDIACALMHYPKVLILDEPTEDLDPLLRKDILALIRRINESGTTIIITSHLLNEMEAICTKIAILHIGQILKVGSVAELKGSYTKNDEIHLKTHPGNYEKILKYVNKRDISYVANRKYKLVLYTQNSERVLKNLLYAIDKTKEKLIDVDVDRPSLEEVFEALTRRKNV